MASIDTENFAIQLTDNAKNHDEWLSIVRFGLLTLLENPLLLMECIVREAERQKDQSGVIDRHTADEARAIMEELGLRVCKSNAECSDG